MKYIIESKVLGEIVDHFWRIEFQARGSPHVHMMLWAKWVAPASSFRYNKHTHLLETMCSFPLGQLS